MLNIYHGGYDSMTRKQLHGVPLERPAQAESRWMGIQHGKLVDGLIESFRELFNLVPLPGSETYAVSPNGAAMIGGFSLGIPGNGKRKKVKPLYMEGIPQETYQAVGFSHSNDCRKSLGIYCGGTVSLCNNGLVSAAHSFRHKHTTGLSLVEWLIDGLKGLWEKFKMTGQRISNLFEHDVTKPSHDRYLLRLSREGIIPWRLIGEVDDCWHQACDPPEVNHVPWSPEYEWDFRQNAWDWYNAVTHIAKKIPPALQLVSLERAFNLTMEMLPKKSRPDLLLEV